jgi:hypothetical protein
MHGVEPETGVIVSENYKYISYGLPLMPQNFTAIPGHQLVNLSWTPPVDDGGTPILRYEVSIDSGITWINVGLNFTYTFTDLTNDVTYTFMVRAVNVIGAGPAAVTTATPFLQLINLYGFISISGITSAGNVLTLDTSRATPAVKTYRIEWLRNGVTIPGENGYTYMLTAADRGTLIQARIHGTEYFTGTLRSNNLLIDLDVPSAPVNFGAIPGNGQVILSWLPPADDGGSPIIGYEVSNDGGLTWIPVGNVWSYTFTGLANGTVYNFAVRAITIMGAGAAATLTSAPSGTTPNIAMVFVVPSVSNNVPAGSILSLSATVFTTNGAVAANQSVTWTVTNGVGAETSINANGFLTISQFEHGRTLTVTARSVADPNVFGTAVVHVMPMPTTQPPAQPPFEPLEPSRPPLPPQERQPEPEEIPPLIIPINRGATGVYAEFDASGNVLFIEPVDGIQKIIDTAIDGKVEFDFTGVDGAISATIPRNMLGRIRNDGLNVQIMLPRGFVIFGQTAMLNILHQMRGQFLTVYVEIADPDTLTTGQNETIGSNTAWRLIVRDGTRIINEFGGNVEVHLPYVLALNSDLAYLVVYHVNNDGGTKTIPNVRYDESRRFVVFTTTHFSIFTIDFNRVSFIDINGHWARTSIMQSAARGLVVGYPDNSYRPNNHLTRAEFIQMLFNAVDLHYVPGHPAFTPYTDVAQGQWYHTAITAAQQNSIVHGLMYADGSFRPNDPITRREMALILSNLATIRNVKPVDNVQVRRFADFTDMGGGYWQAIENAINVGFLNADGMGNNMFAPLDYVTRAQAATIQIIVLQVLGRLN